MGQEWDLRRAQRSGGRLAAGDVGSAGPQRDTRQTWLLALVCVGAGAAPFAVRWISGDVATRIVYGLLITVVYAAVAWLARRTPSLRPYWELAFAFFVLALSQVLNNSIPAWVGTELLHDPPNAGNPMASTTSGTVIVQLLETIIAIGSVVGFTLASGGSLSSIYAQPGTRGRWLVFAVVFFVFCFVL